MKSLLERAKARPSYAIGIVIAIIAFVSLLWWALSPSPKENIAQQPKPSIISNQKIIVPVKQSEASAPASTAANTDSAVNQANVAPASASVTTAPTTPANTVLPKDPATAAEELDRLKDEQNRLKERKKELAKQLAMSNKLVALKDQQLKDLGQTNP